VALELDLRSGNEDVDEQPEGTEGQEDANDLDAE
jgi:hypothetical protein